MERQIPDNLSYHRCLNRLGHMLYQVWLPTQDAVVRVPTDRLKPLDAHSSMLNLQHLSYIVTAARIKEIAMAVEVQALLDFPAVGIMQAFYEHTARLGS
jgi:hypothetical protein